MFSHMCSPLLSTLKLHNPNLVIAILCSNPSLVSYCSSYEYQDRSMQLPQSSRKQVSSFTAPLTLPRMPTPEVHIKCHGKHWTSAQEILPECLPTACLELSHTSHTVLSSLGFSLWLPLCSFPRVELVTVPQTLGTDLRFCGARVRHHLKVITPFHKITNTN